MLGELVSCLQVIDGMKAATIASQFVNNHTGWVLLVKASSERLP